MPGGPEPHIAKLSSIQFGITVTPAGKLNVKLSAYSAVVLAIVISIQMSAPRPVAHSLEVIVAEAFRSALASGDMKNTKKEVKTSKDVLILAQTLYHEFISNINII